MIANKKHSQRQSAWHADTVDMECTSILQIVKQFLWCPNLSVEICQYYEYIYSISETIARKIKSNAQTG